MRQILYLIQKEFRQVFRDPAMVTIIFFAPLVQMVVMGFAITVDVKHVKTVIADYDGTSASREIIRKFEHNPYFDVTGYANGTSEITDMLDRWQAQVAIVIPPNFSRELLHGAAPAVQVIADGVDGNTAGIALGYAQGILADFVLDLISEGELGTARLLPVSLVTAKTRMWYNLDLESKNYMVPGLIAVLLTLVGMFLSSMALVREKELGTLEQLMVSPIRTWQLILGKATPFLILGFVELAVMIGVAFVVFQLTIAGNIFLLFGLAALYLLSALGLGIFISTLAQTQQQAMFISWFFIVFLIFMSGWLFPIENMPAIMQKLTLLDPMRYFVTILREIFLKGATARHLFNEILSLVAFAAVILTLSSLKFQKRVQ